MQEVYSPWGIAHNEAQRLALRVDPTYSAIDGGMQGLIAARAIAMLLYRHKEIFDSKLIRDTTLLDSYSASSYQYNKGLEFSNRFHHHSYWALSKAMDSHDILRGRNKTMEYVLKSITTKCLIIGIDKDLLFPVSEQIILHDNIIDSSLEIISSKYGHDAFLIEVKKITEILEKFI